MAGVEGLLLADNPIVGLLLGPRASTDSRKTRLNAVRNLVHAPSSSASTMGSLGH